MKEGDRERNIEKRGAQRENRRDLLRKGRKPVEHSCLLGASRWKIRRDAGLA